MYAGGNVSKALHNFSSVGPPMLFKQSANYHIPFKQRDMGQPIWQLTLLEDLLVDIGLCLLRGDSIKNTSVSHMFSVIAAVSVLLTKTSPNASFFTAEISLRQMLYLLLCGKALLKTTVLITASPTKLKDSHLKGSFWGFYVSTNSIKIQDETMICIITSISLIQKPDLVVGGH